MGIWSILEQLCIIVCGSLPVLRQWLVHLVPHIHVDWGTTKNTTIRAGAQPSPQNENMAIAAQPPRLPRPVPRWQTLGSLFNTTHRADSVLFDRTRTQAAASWEELTDRLESQGGGGIEKATGDNALRPVVPLKEFK